MAAARLRRTFHYPSDADGDGDDGQPLAMDEEEQEKLIATLERENEARNFRFLQMFLALPASSAVLFCLYAIRNRGGQAKVLAFLCITSLLLTAYMLVLVPNRPMRQAVGSIWAKATRDGAPGPVRRHLPHLNGALAVLLALGGLSMRERVGAPDGLWLMCCVPLVEYGIVLAARRFIVEVDPSELEALKYEFKGA